MLCSFCVTERNAVCSYETALKAFTVTIADIERSTRVVASPNCAANRKKRLCKMICRTTMAGTMNSITRVRAHDRRDPREASNERGDVLSEETARKRRRHANFLRVAEPRSRVRKSLPKARNNPPHQLWPWDLPHQGISFAG